MTWRPRGCARRNLDVIVLRLPIWLPSVVLIRATSFAVYGGRLLKKSISALLALSALLLAGSMLPHKSWAAPNNAPTPVPVAHPDFSSMQIFLGTWTCRARVRGKDRPDTSTTTMGLDGEYMVTRDVAPVFDKYRTRALNSTSYVTFNPRTRQWVTISVDNLGGYGVSTSPGWSGDSEAVPLS